MRTDRKYPPLHVPVTHFVPRTDKLKRVFDCTGFTLSFKFVARCYLLISIFNLINKKTRAYVTVSCIPIKFLTSSRISLKLG
jgi:hypothetical protein